MVNIYPLFQAKYEFLKALLLNNGSKGEMTGKEWDEPKQLEVAKFERLNAKRDVAADDPAVQYLEQQLNR